VSATVVRPGDNVTITGSNFSSDPERNRVVFNNELAKAVPISARADMLVVTVPDYASSGPMHVVTTGLQSAAVAMEIQRDPGAVWVVGGGENYQFKLPAATGAEEYVLIQYSAAAGGVEEYVYTVTPDTTSVFPLHGRGQGVGTVNTNAAGKAGSGRVAAVTPASDCTSLGIARRAVRHARDKRSRSMGFQAAGSRRQSAHTLRESRVGTGVAPTRDFFVVATTDSVDLNDPVNYSTITADLKTTGTHVLVYADVDQPTGSFLQPDYDAFTTLFDNQLFPTDTTFFAPATDIDLNDRLIVVFTPKVNDLTPDNTPRGGAVVTGFFHLPDIAPSIFDQTSNNGEILYIFVPDPNGERGNMFEKSRVDSIVPAVAAHELEHVLSFGYRYITLGKERDIGLLQDTWLEEGLAHIAEDLNGVDFANIARINRYFADPGATSLRGDDTVEQRGAIFLFLRYLGDRFGTGIYRDIVQTLCRGALCVELATGTDFYELVEGFLAALYVNDRGLAADPRYDIMSFDVQNDLDAVPVVNMSAGGSAFSSNVLTAAGDFYHLTGLSAPATEIRVAGSSPGAHIRSVIIRVK
jgi:hypothetical protein